MSRAAAASTLSRLAEGVFDRLWEWGRRGWVWLAVGVGGLVLGSQIHSPNQRVFQVIAAVFLTLGAIRVESVVGLLILIPLLPFPKVTTYGSTNVAFVLLVFIVWLARVVLRLEKPAGRSPLDLPVLLLVMAYLLSFSQIGEREIIRHALTNFWLALTYVALCYLVIHLVREERNLRRVVVAVLVMGALVELTAMFELFYPDRPLVPGWIDLSYGRRIEYIREGLEITNLRVGGAIGDYELLAEFCAMLVLLQWFAFRQARGGLERAVMIALLLLSGFVLLATVTRGALVSLALAGAYLLWISRRHLRFHVVVLTGLVALLAGGILLDLVAEHTRSANVFERFAETEFKGLVPDSRENVWRDAWERAWESPIVGHGPYFTSRIGVRQFFWPHNNYLFYMHIVGLVGLAAYLFVLFRLWRATRGHADHLGHESYARGLLLALRAMLVLFVIDQIKIDYLRNEIYAYWVWLFFGLTIATGRLARAETAGAGGKPEVAPSPSPAARRRISAAPAVLREGSPGS